jgi:DNA-binding transcriptional LysR family regulator
MQIWNERMNLRYLQTFVRVAEAGGFARAGSQLNLSQPAASRQILALEAELGVALFDRIGRRVHLSSEGEDLLQRSRRLLADAVSIGERARALKGGKVGTLRVGAPTQVIENLLAPFVPRYQRRHPGVDVHLTEAASTRLQGLVDRGDVHLGVLPSGHDILHGRLLYPIYVTAAVAAQHPFARRRVLEIAELDDKPLLLMNRQLLAGLRSWFDAACDVAHARPRAVFESAAPQTLVALAAESYGIAIVPSDVRILHGNVRLVPLVHRKVPVGRWACISWDPRRFLPPYAEKFVEELAASVRRSFPGRDLIRRAPAIPQQPRPLARTKV